MSRPDSGVVAALILTFVAAAGAAIAAPRVDLVSLEVVHIIGAAVGMFGAVILLGRLRLDTNGKRISGTFVDWPVEVSSVGTLLFVGSWLAGLVNLWFVGIEVSRVFT